MPDAPHFTPKLFSFLRSLKRNNDRAWFQRNKPRYLEQVRDPMLQFIEDFGSRLAKVSRRFIADPSPTGGSMFRIYRDTRFAKDKRPYKTTASAQFRHEQGKDVHAPGFYLHLAPGEVFFGAGLWHPDGPTLGKIRDGIVARPAAWRRLMGSAPIADGRFALAGESLKRPPRGFDPAHPLIEDLKRKDFIVVRHLDEAAACRADFIDEVASLATETRPFVRFLTMSIDLPF